MICASAGSHRCQACSPPGLKAVNIGSSDTASTTTVVLACASLKDLLRMATAINSADSSAASGSNSARNSPVSRRPN